MKRFLCIIPAAAMLSGCASGLTPEEIEYRDGERAKVWEVCKKLGPTVSTHEHRKNKQHRPSDIHQDNVLNGCYRRVGNKY